MYFPPVKKQRFKRVNTLIGNKSQILIWQEDVEVGGYTKQAAGK